MTGQDTRHPIQHIGGTIMVVMMEVEPEHEAEFNRWYDEEHLAERLEIPGYISARRFKLEEGSGGVLKYLCIWELEDIRPLQSDDMKAQRLRPSELRDRVYTYITQRARGVYRQIYPEVGAFEDHSGFHPEQQKV
jgi:antibiotic biosynthesis monooxygenase (ABM) superfamily enzyme